MKNNPKYRNADQTNLIPFKMLKMDDTEILNKPKWIRIKLPTNFKKIEEIQNKISNNNLHSVCKEASCPNLPECFNKGTATFMILGTICTRKCSFCDVAHGRPKNPDPNEPEKLAITIKDMKLKYVVITSVNRDDLQDGGAQHFLNSITSIRQKNPNIKIEILVPDFRKCISRALEILSISPPDVFNHNIESVPRIYKKVRPGANYKKSLELLERFKKIHPDIPTKSGLMVGLGETNREIIDVMNDLRFHGVNMLTIGQYLQPTPHHLSVKRYVFPEEFMEIKKIAISMGFTHAACGPLVRSSYLAELQFQEMLNK